MKAVVCERYGPPEVLQFSEVRTPVPANDEVLIRIHAATVTSGDWRVRSLNVPTGFRLISRLALGINGPRQPILGTELAGEIESVGKDVTRFKVGDEVFAFGGVGMGCHAEYRCMKENGLIAQKPPALSFQEAAALTFGGTTALSFFRRGKLQRGEKVLINGASGGVGTAAVQLARHFGAEVTGVCSTANVELVASLGADHVIDYTREDFAQRGETYDVIMDTAGTAPFARSKGSLKENGRLLQVLGGLTEMLRVPWVSLTGSRRIIAGPASERAEDVLLLGGLAESGEFRAVIDRSYAFDDIVEAHRYVDTGRKKGNVVLTLEHRE
jgi:NADPH:quinone reductase-like Zn-dependent oxidoreductase